MLFRSQKLTLTQDDIQIKGHAIEVRLNAEQPELNFAPSAGPIDYLYVPNGGNGVRIDTDLFTGAVVQPFYDSMIGKLIASGEDREAALTRLHRLLDEIVLGGIKTNINFQKALVQDAHVKTGDFNTKYLENEFLPTWLAEVSAHETV